MNALTMNITVEDPIAVFTVIGEIDLHTQDLFERAVAEQLARSPVVVDLSGVEFLAISALRSLLACNAAAARHGHELYYAQVPGQVLRLLSITGLDEALPLRASVAEVICPSATSPMVLVRPGAGVTERPRNELAQSDAG